MAEQTKSNKTSSNRKRPVWQVILGILLVGAVVLFALYQVPAIHDRAYFYLTTLRSRVYYFSDPQLNPPSTLRRIPPLMRVSLPLSGR